MSDATTSRVLRLLGLLQTRRAWTGPELAVRLGVDERTVRRDVERLRALGYRVSATRGSVGGYRLEAGSDLPPLLFSGEEAVALALALRTGGASGAGSESLASVLAKLEQVLPRAARGRVHALQETVAVPGPVHADPAVDTEVLALLALACRDSERIRFAYAAATRRVDPVSLVPLRGRWYLVAWDADRADWRTFRVDRMTAFSGTRRLVPRRRVPGGDAAAFVETRFAPAPVVRAVIVIAAPHAEVAALLGPFTSGLEADGHEGTRWTIADERVEILAGALAWLIWPFAIAEGEELRRFVGGFAERLGPAAQARSRSSSTT